MKELKIEIPEGYEVDTEKSTFEKIVFKPIPLKKPAWADFGVVKGYYVTTYGTIYETNDLLGTEANQNTWPTLKEAKACLALSQLCQWRNKYNGDWTPDWRDESTKYIIYGGMSGLTKGSGDAFPYVLSFKTKEIRDKFFEDFQDLLLTVLPLL